MKKRYLLLILAINACCSAASDEGNPNPLMITQIEIGQNGVWTTISKQNVRFMQRDESVYNESFTRFLMVPMVEHEDFPIEEMQAALGAGFAREELLLINAKNKEKMQKRFNIINQHLRAEELNAKVKKQMGERHSISMYELVAIFDAVFGYKNQEVYNLATRFMNS